MVARLEKTPRSVMFSGQDWMFKKPTKTEIKIKNIYIYLAFTRSTYAFKYPEYKTEINMFFTLTADIG